MFRSYRRSSRSTLRPGSILARPAGGAGRARRASVIILALAVLAVIAIAGVAYVTVVRLDRSSAAAYAETINYQQQINAVVEEIRALLAADLFGNKIVTATTPRVQTQSDPNSAGVWPRAFEDGEFFDYPQVAFYDEDGNRTFDDRPPTSTGLNPDDPFVLNPEALRNTAAQGRAIALQDDAWLASLEPIRMNGQGEWNVWPQITNLRSAYRFRPPANASQPGYWVRDDGLYVDLAQWFYQATTDNRGNPSANLARVSRNGDPWTDPVLTARPVNDPIESATNTNGPLAGMFQQAFDRSMSEMGKRNATYADEAFDILDERMWADTDGDGFPDARWQQLDSLGELFGLRWVVAARIVDNSGLANVNAHLALASPNDPQNLELLGDGTTPADVDLYRLLQSYSVPQPGYPDRVHPDIDRWNAGRMFDAYARGSLVNGLSVDQVLGQLQSPRSGTDPTRYVDKLTRLYNNGVDISIDQNQLANNGTLSRPQKEAYWRFFGSNPRDPLATRGAGYPISDEIDLRTFSSSNYESILSRVEQSFDYSLNGEFLPPAQGRNVGLMRSNRVGSLDPFRNPGDTTVPRHPLAERQERIRKDVRRLLTTTSGAGNMSPIPAASPVPRVPLTPDAFTKGAAGNPVLNGETVKSAFQAFVWALAPFATDRPMIRGLSREQLGDLQTPDSARDLSYGGGSSGPAIQHNYPAASYSVLKAASLATNLAAAMTEIPRPTIVRVYPDATRTDDPTTQEVVEMGVGFQHGSIGAQASDPDGVPQTATLLPPDYFGAPDTGVTLFGLDRPLFLIEAASVAVYRNFDDNGTMPEGPVSVDGMNINDQLGSIFAVELANPWTEPVNLNIRTFQALVTGTGFEMTLQLNGGAIINGPTTILPGRTLILMWASEPNPIHDPAEWIEFVDAWIAEVEGRVLDVAGGLQGVSTLGIPALQTSPPPSSIHIPWQDIALANVALPIALLENLGDSATPRRILVDRMSPKTGPMSPFPLALNGTTSDPGALDIVGGERGTGRFAFASNLKRPKGQGITPGFPSFVIERPEANETLGGRLTPQIWRLTNPQEPPDPSADLGIEAVASIGPNDPNDMGEAATTHANLPAFELFQPPAAPVGGATSGSPFAAVSELGMLSTVCTMFKNTQPGEGLESDAAMMATVRNRPASGAMAPGDWVTFSERLGFDENFPASPGAAPSFGVLDFSRFILTPDGASPGDLNQVEHLPDTMAVPLATRVFDCFDALLEGGRVANGRVNINTALRDVLEILPFIDPDSSWLPSSVYNALTTSTSGVIGTGVRVQSLLRYRDRNLPAREQPNGTLPQTQLNGYTADADYPTFLTGLPGMRTPATNATGPQERPRSGGFGSLGELAVFGGWDPLTGRPSATSPEQAGMLILGSNGQPDTTMPLDMRNALTGNDSPPIAIMDSYEASDDPEERLALFRAVSNIATTRSDIFTAWFVVRGYAPADIEAVRVDQGSGDSALSTYFNGGGAENRPALRPAFEQRWLAVFDRSNVRSPTDRPKVLLLTELPIDRPAAIAN